MLLTVAIFPLRIAVYSSEHCKLSNHYSFKPNDAETTKVKLHYVGTELRCEIA